MMLEYQLKADKDGKVRYLMKQAGANVAARTTYREALRMIGGEAPYVTHEFEDYPLTADGVYYFDAMYRLTEDEGEE